MIDGGLRPIFRQHLPHFHWVSVETGGTGLGIPDSNYCVKIGENSDGTPIGVEGWIEHKTTDGWVVTLRSEQVGWMLRRSRAGGRVTIAVRRKAAAGPRRGKAVDELWMLRGALANEAKAHGLPKFQMPEFGGRPTTLTVPDCPYMIAAFGGGPANWDWAQVEAILRSD